MSTTIRDLAVRLGFDVDEQQWKRIDAGVENIKKSMIVVGGLALAAGGALIAIANNVANIGKEAKETAMSLGLTTEALQELEFAASISGVSKEEARTSLRLLANSATDAARGLESAKRAYNELGISPSVNGKLKSTDELLMDIAEKFSKMPDSLQKTALANDLFGRSGARLIPFFNQGAVGIAALRQEARDLGYVMSEEDAEASDAFNDSLTRLFAVIRGIKIQIGMGLIPVMTEYLKLAIEWVRQNQEMIRQKLDFYLHLLTGYLKALWIIARNVVKTILDLTDSFGGLERVAYAVAGFLALKFVYGVGLLAQGVWGVVSAFAALGTAGMIATIKAAALPLLIGVAIAALLLAIEDIYHYFKGDGYETVTGVIVDAFEKKYPKAFEKTKQALLEIKKLFDEIKDTFNFGYVKETGLGRNDAIEGKTYPTPSIFSNIIDMASSLWGGGGRFFLSPSTGSNITNNSPNISVNVNAPINVPANTPQAEIGPRLQAGVKDAISEILWQTYNATSPKVEY